MSRKKLIAGAAIVGVAWKLIVIAALVWLS